MSETPHCQSCSRPMTEGADFGTELNGLRSGDFCSCCYQMGRFTEPEVTLDEMIDRVIAIVIQNKMMSAEEAYRQLPGYFRTLQRWRA